MEQTDYPISDIEKALADERFPAAARELAGWRRRTRRRRTAADRRRAHLLAFSLDLLAERLKPAERRFRVLRRLDPSLPPPYLEARLLALRGQYRAAIETLDRALAPLAPVTDLPAAIALLHERALLRLETGDSQGGQDDLAEAARLAGIAGDSLARSAINMDLAGALIAADERAAAAELLGKVSARSAKLRLHKAALLIKCGSSESGASVLNTSAIREPRTAAEAHLLLAIAQNEESRGDAAGCERRLACLEAAGWVDALGSIAAETMILRAGLALKQGDPKRVRAILKRFFSEAAPGARQRTVMDADWLRMQAEMTSGRPGAALSAGRRIARELEKRKRGLSALSQLRRLSRNLAEFHRSLVSLELRHGSPTRALEALQRFTGRGLLRACSTDKPALLETSLGFLETSRSAGKHPGRGPLRRLIRDLASRRPEALRWKEIIALLRAMSSDQHNNQGHYTDNQRQE